MGSQHFLHIALNSLAAGVRPCVPRTGHLLPTLRRQIQAGAITWSQLAQGEFSQAGPPPPLPSHPEARSETRTSLSHSPRPGLRHCPADGGSRLPPQDRKLSLQLFCEVLRPRLWEEATWSARTFFLGPSPRSQVLSKHPWASGFVV